MAVKRYIKMPRPARLDHLHGEHDLHSPIISLEPFIFISYSLPRAARPLNPVFVAAEKKVSTFAKFVIDFASVGVQVVCSLQNKIYESVVSRMEKFYACIIHAPIYLSRSCYVNLP